MVQFSPSGMAVKTLLLLFAAFLTQETIGLSIEGIQSHQTDTKNDWPCPEAIDILPCICNRSGTELKLDCSNVKDNTELENVFKAFFPFHNFTLLTIIAKPEEPRIPITVLESNVFQNVTFANIHISHTDLNIIYPSAFDKSAPFLETIIVTDNKLLVFPFDLVDKAPLLTDIRVFRNNLQHMPEMTSNSLTYLHIGYNPGLQFGDHALEFLPNLEYFIANNIDLSHVARNAFYYNTKLKYLDLSFNLLETLYEESLTFRSPIEEILLNSNRIHTIQEKAISGLGSGSYTFLWLHQNDVANLAQSVWEPVFNSVRGKIRSFVFDGNPFICQCNILWLVENDEHRETIAEGTYCTDTETELHEVDVGFLQDNCD